MLHKALDEITRKRNAVGCAMKMIWGDKQFKSSMDEVKDKMNITVDHSDTGALASVAKQNNRVMEEWCCMAMHHLPHKTTS